MKSVHGRQVIQPGSQSPSASGQLREQWGNLSASQRGPQKNATPQGTEPHSHAAPMSTLPSPAGLRDDRGSIVEGPRERSGLSVTNLKKFHSLHPTVNLSSSLFSITPIPHPGQYPGSCHNMLSSVLPNSLEPQQRRTFSPCATWTWNHPFIIPPGVRRAEYECMFFSPILSPVSPLAQTMKLQCTAGPLSSNPNSCSVRQTSLQ